MQRLSFRALPVKGVREILCLVGILLGTAQLSAQDTLRTTVFSEQEFLAVLRAYHPVVRQADYRMKEGEAMVLIARGAFDPLLRSNSSRKRFEGDLYYSYYNPELMIPTWYGVEVFAGLENINGAKVNTESSLGKTSYMGVKVPLLRNVVIDKRRAALSQAKLFRQQSVADRNLMVNDLLYEALTAYWNWVRDYQLLQVFNTTIRVNEDRLRMVKLEFQQGNRPAIDTLEALTQLQQFQLFQNEASLNFRNTTLEVSNYLWKELDLPYVLPESVIPDTSWQRQVDDLEPPVLEQLLVQTRNSHPKLLSYRYKVDLLSIEQKLKFQGLLPQLDLKAHVLDKGYQWTNNLSNSFLEKNYRFGVDFSLPLRLSEGRGAYQQARLKKSAAQLEVNLQEWWIENKVKSYYNEVMMLRQQIQITENALGNFQKLLEGETLRFRSGESTVFLMNQRELKVLDYQQKFQELRTKYLKSYVALSWSAGQLR